MKTVLHYTGYTAAGGGILGVIHNLAGAGRFRVLLGVSPGFPAEASGGLTLWQGPAIDGEEITPATIWRARAVAKAAQAWLREDPDRVFHGHSRAGLLVAGWLHRRGETRVVASVHCYGRQRWFYRRASHALGRRLFWLSPAMREHYGAPGHGWDRCIPGGVHESTVGPAERVPGRLRLGGVGALVRWKRWDRVLAALARLEAADREAVTFTHIGGGEKSLGEELEKETSRLGLSGQVTWRGVEPSSAKLLGEIDALVIASECEPFSLAMLEALAAGVPVIAASSGGARDVIEDGVNGTLFSEDDGAALAGKLRTWLRDPPALARETIRASAKRVGEVAAQWAKVYEELDVRM